ncbi:MAG: glycoside hydrolase family 5 protein [Opitutaceae bacterium]|jgi:hypothetical protein
MSKLPSFLSRNLLFSAGLLSVVLFQLHARNSAPAASIVENSNMETDANGDGWPDGWPKLKSGGSWENEEGNHFIRLTSTQPGDTVMLYREISITEGTKAIEMTWRQRITGLKRGPKAWFDARIMMEFMDAGRAAVAPSPKPPAAHKDTAGWEDKSARFLVPEGARIIKFMPSLFQVEAGTYDLDDIVLTPVDAAPIQAASDEAAAARTEKLAADTAARQAKVAASLEAGGALISNGDFEKPNKTGDFAADWAKSGSWGTDADGNRFLRLTSTEPGKTAMSFRSLTLPAGVKAFELSLRWRITDLKPGDMPWFDARIMMDIKDAAGNKLQPQPSPVYTRKNTPDDAWVERSVAFLIPEGGVTLDLMPALFQVKAGTLDLDNIVLKPADPAPILARQKERAETAAKARVPAEEPNHAKWPPELRVQGNRLVTVDGGREVWLQGLNVPSLEWSVNGEQVLKSTVVGIDEWKSNVIRLPVKEEYWFGRKGQTDGGKSYRDLVDQVIVLAANRGAYVVLDLHRYRAPTAAFLEFWTDAATRYKNHPAVIFDLMNEPHGISWEIWRNGGFVGEKKDRDEAAFLTAEEKARAQGFESVGMQTMLDTVRATGARNIAVVGGLDYAYDLSGIVNGFALDDKSGHGIMYACHIYPWKRNWQKKLLDAAALHPILLGEVGADAKKMDFMPHDIQEDAATWVPDILGLIQQHKLNWTGWCFHPRSSPRMLLDWDYTPTPFWGQPAKDALGGKRFPPPSRLR